MIVNEKTSAIGTHANRMRVNARAEGTIATLGNRPSEIRVAFL
jgi:hypothetical protein